MTTLNISNNVKTIGEGAFLGCMELTTITIPNSVTSIYGNAFDGCSSATTLILGSGVENIYEGAFSNCSNLTAIYALPTTPPDLGGSNVFKDINESCKFYFHGTAYTNDTCPWSNIGSYTDDYIYSVYRCEGVTYEDVIVSEGNYYYYKPNDVVNLSHSAGTESFVMKNADVVPIFNKYDNSSVLAENLGSSKNVVLTDRTLYKDGAWNTLCLPFDVVLEDFPLKGNNVVAMTLDTGTSNLSDGTLTLNFTAIPSAGEQAGLITAGTPFIIKWASKDAPATDLVNPIFTDVTIASDASAEVGFTGGKFVGTYSPVSFTANDQSKLFLGAANTLYWSNAAMTVGAFRAYFDMGTYTARQFVLNFGDGSETSSLNDKVQMINDKEAGAWYDLQGRKLESSIFNSPLGSAACNKQESSIWKKGLYIHGGKKVVIK